MRMIYQNPGPVGRGLPSLNPQTATSTFHGSTSLFCSAERAQVIAGGFRLSEPRPTGAGF